MILVLAIDFCVGFAGGSYAFSLQPQTPSRLASVATSK
jgi:hypothetical protein